MWAGQSPSPTSSARLSLSPGSAQARGCCSFRPGGRWWRSGRRADPRAERVPAVQVVLFRSVLDSRTVLIPHLVVGGHRLDALDRGVEDVQRADEPDEDALPRNGDRQVGEAVPVEVAL